ncbi:unnamed protein product [Schistosoma margrebowiei]|uniref:Uncharacterized protein n=1 Tax=Schistosoma margrebowiei TaxID=48269 RepID=A0AA85AJ31_9TREM|nr:unnamed protein product [Schistosoma margrebowiei]
MFRLGQYLLILSVISILLKSCDASFLNSTWNKIVQRVTSGLHFSEYSTLIYIY